MTSRELLESISVVIAADGCLDEKEKRYLLGIAKQLGVSRTDIAAIFDKVRAGNGVVAAPASLEEKADLYAHLIKAAAADGEITALERRILNDVAEHLHAGDVKSVVAQTVAVELDKPVPKDTRVGNDRSDKSVGHRGHSALTHFIWAAAVVVVVCAAFGSVLFDRFFPSPKAGFDAVTDGAGTVYGDATDAGRKAYEDLKGGANKLANLLRTKEKEINQSIFRVCESKASLIVARSSVTVDISKTVVRSYLPDSSARLVVPGIRCQYVIELKSPVSEVDPSSQTVLLKVPRPKLDEELIQIPDSESWIGLEQGIYGSEEVLAELKGKVKAEAIKIASEAGNEDYERATKEGLRNVKDIIEQTLKDIVPEASLKVEYLDAGTQASASQIPAAEEKDRIADGK